MSTDENETFISLTPHPWAPRLEEGEEEHDSAITTIVGFVGSARRQAHIRIYLDLTFSSYCEVAVADVMRTRPVDPDDDVSPTVVWVKASAHVSLMYLGRFSGSASYVTGRIRDANSKTGSQEVRPYAGIYQPHPTHSPTDCTLFCETRILCESVDVCVSATIICKPEPRSNDQLSCG